MDEIAALHIALTASPEFFRECVDYTARQTGFRRDLVEKDYYCSVIVAHLTPYLPAYAVFKGGTCVSKVYADFYRLSEDLDYSISTTLDATRDSRRARIDPVKKLCGSPGSQPVGLHEIEPFHGFNQSKQYMGIWGYRSRVSGDEERIKIEFGLREPSLIPDEQRTAHTLLLNPVAGERAVTPFTVRVMALPEIWAEKARAALTRREAAIRDFFDLDYAVRNLGLDPRDKEFIALLRKKLAVPGNEAVDLSGERRAELNRQVEAQLKPVVRTIDFERFDLGRIWDAVTALARSASSS
jgi:predicted nucleotidyltransferase component of viral defense system